MSDVTELLDSAKEWLRPLGDRQDPQTNMIRNLAAELTRSTARTPDESLYWAKAVALISDTLKTLKVEEFAGRRDKMIAVLRNAAYRIGGETALDGQPVPAEAIHDICHDLHGTVNARAFNDGCNAEMRRLYGCAPDADDLKDLEASFDVFHKASMALMRAYKAEHPDVPENVWPDTSRVNEWAERRLRELTEQRDACQRENSRLALAKQTAESGQPAARTISTPVIVRRMREAVAAQAGVERGCPVVSAWQVKEWADDIERGSAAEAERHVGAPDATSPGDSRTAAGEGRFESAAPPPIFRAVEQRLPPGPSGPCQKCKARPATETWCPGGTLAWAHGAYQFWCKRCTLEAQLDHCLAAAARVPAIERELKQEEEARD